MVFDYVDNMNVYVSINGNESIGLDQLVENAKITQWEQNGHYYLYIPEMRSWTDAFNYARTLKIAGEQGYLATLTSVDEIKYLQALVSDSVWVGGTQLLKSDGARINGNESEINRTEDSLKVGALNSRAVYYWACGPETGIGIPDEVWYAGEPNSARPNINQVYDTTLRGLQYTETCLMVIVPGRGYPTYGINDVPEGGYNGTPIDSKGFFVEFGGYADGADPGQPDNTKKGETNVLVAPMDAEAVINGVKYAPLADALDMAQAGDTVEIVKDTVTAVTGGTLKKGVQLKSKDGTWFSAPGDAVDVTLDVAADGTVTLKDGTLNVSDNGTLNVYSPVDLNTYKVTTPAGASSVVVPNGTGDDTPYLKNHNTTGALT